MLSSRPLGKKSLKNVELNSAISRRNPNTIFTLIPAADPARRNQATSTGSMVGPATDHIVPPAWRAGAGADDGTTITGAVIGPQHAVQRELEQAMVRVRGLERGKLHGKLRATAVACRTPPASGWSSGNSRNLAGETYIHVVIPARTQWAANVRPPTQYEFF
jgi:hypothetical protein